MKFIEKLKIGATVLGPFSKTSDAAFVEVMGFAGFDFIIIDLEHGPNSYLNAQNLVRAAKGAGTFPIIRVPTNSAVDIGKALDIGAMGIQVPQISTKNEAVQAMQSSKFHPLGMRGVCRFVRAAEYSNKDRFEYFRESNDNFLILQLEGVEGIANFEEIVEVEGINIIFLGPYDLSQALGVSGQINHPLVLEKMKTIIMECASRGIKTGVFTDNLADARGWKELGVDYISFSVDVGIMLEACKSIIKQI